MNPRFFTQTIKRKDAKTQRRKERKNKDIGTLSSRLSSFAFHLFFVYTLFIALVCSGCTPKRTLSSDPHIAELQQKTENRKLVSIHIVDQNGLSETIGAKERLETYKDIDFLESQTYQKVLRVYAKDAKSNTFSLVTSYYPNGQVKQYLEAENGQARGRYLEWYQNGQKKLLCSVLGGTADLDEKSQSNWIFDGENLCWSETGALKATLPYEKGVLSGIARYFHTNGNTAEEIPYVQGHIEGEKKEWDEEGDLIATTLYFKGEKHGSSLGYWNPTLIAWQEEWEEGQLKTGLYKDAQGVVVSLVEKGTGKRVIFDEAGPVEIHEYTEGRPEGEILLLDEQRRVVQKIHVKNGVKHGQELYYHSDYVTPKLSIDWYEGNIHGYVRTWYDDGSLESQREMSRNCKQGHLSAWYSTGELMFIEEYEKDQLVRGEYLKKGEKIPVSRVIEGTGVATFFDKEGTFLRRVEYQKGKPVVELE
jgi:antitoxin component YwqK of YwqJK toxin-antitoxin module